MRDPDDPREAPNRRGVILVDNYDDELIEATAWVEVFDSRFRRKSYAGCARPGDAVKVIEQHFPLEDREEEEHYICNGEQVILAPEEPGTEDWPYAPWKEVEDDTEPGALHFWVVRVVCNV